MFVLPVTALDDLVAAAALTGDEYDRVDDADDTDAGEDIDSGVEVDLLDDAEDDRLGMGGRLAIPLALVLRNDKMLVELPDWDLLDEVDDLFREPLDFTEEFGVFLPPDTEGDPPFLSLEYNLFALDGSPFDPLDMLPVELRPVVATFLLEDTGDFPEVEDV